MLDQFQVKVNLGFNCFNFRRPSTSVGINVVHLSLIRKHPKLRNLETKVNSFEPKR